MQVFRRLWRDEAGFIISSELVLVATILVIGMIVGLTELRNQVVEELVDVSQAIGSLSQTYAYTAVGKSGVAFTDGSYYNDLVDFCQSSQVAAVSAPGGISVSLTPLGEQGAVVVFGTPTGL
jgi:Flp pilus assembly pilin Flp